MIVDNIKRVYFIENDCTVSNLLFLDSYNANTDIIICFNYLPAYVLKEKGIDNFFMTHEILSSSDYSEIHDKTDIISNSWFLDNGVDCSEFEGISSGNLVSVMFDRKFITGIIVTYTQILKKLLDKYHNIERVIHDFSVDDNYFYFPDDGYRRFFSKKESFEEACHQLSIFVEYINPESPIPSEHICKENNKVIGLARLKLLVLDLLFRVIDLTEIFKNRSIRSSIYLDFSGNTESLLYNYNGNKRLLASSVPFRFIRNKFYLLFGSIKRFDFNKTDCLNYGVFYNKNILKGLVRRKASKNFFEFNGIDYGYLYIPIINHLIDYKIPELRITSRKIVKSFDTYNINTVIVNNIRTEDSKNIICTAKLNNIKSVFVDHGIQGHIHAKSVIHYIEPDLYVSTGSYLNYMLNSKSVYLGNPSLDSFTFDKRKRVSKLGKILFLSFGDNFYARYDRFIYQEKYYSIIFNAIKILHGHCEIFYRSHNSNRDFNDYIFNFFGVHDFLTLSEDHRFEDIVYDYDLVVCNVTNCFYQSISAGVPVIFVEPELIDNSLNLPFSGKNFDEIIRVSNSTDLINLIMRNIENPQELSGFVDDFHAKYSEKYLGKLDGNSAKRVFDELLSD